MEELKCFSWVAFGIAVACVLAVAMGVALHLGIALIERL